MRLQLLPLRSITVSPGNRTSLLRLETKVHTAYYFLGLNARRSFYDALFTFAETDASNTLPVCSTGNCTWPSFSSLAVCSFCTDLTSQLRYNPDYGHHEWELSNGYGIFDGVYATVDNLVRPYTASYDPIANQTFLDMLYYSQILENGSWTQAPCIRMCDVVLC